MTSTASESSFGSDLLGDKSSLDEPPKRMLATVPQVQSPALPGH